MAAEIARLCAATMIFESCKALVPVQHTHDAAHAGARLGVLSEGGFDVSGTWVGIVTATESRRFLDDSRITGWL